MLLEWDLKGGSGTVFIDDPSAAPRHQADRDTGIGTEQSTEIALE